MRKLFATILAGLSLWSVPANADTWATTPDRRADLLRDDGTSVSVERARPYAIAGKWDMVADGHQGWVQFNRTTNGGWSGQIYIGTNNRTEPLANIRYSANTGEIRFDRPMETQSYVGTVRANSMSATFRGSHTTRIMSWTATRAAIAGNQNMVNLALNKPARQSSTHRGGSASRAADANTDGNWYNESVSHTELEQNPWWEVDLQNMSQITRVTLFNRTDCCGERLNNAVVVIFDANRREVARRSIGNAQNVMPVSFGVRGRYVRVVLPRRDYLSLAEVRVIGSAPPMVTPNMVNLALNKPARQSSTHRGGSASRAADANTDGNWYNESVSHTELEQNPWWEVDLQNMSQITRVTLFNRTDCCGERLNNAVVVIFDANRREVARRSIGNAQNVMPVSFGVRGRYVRVVLPRRDYLSLAEVRVIGSAPPMVTPNMVNLALNKPARQSSTHRGGSASRAADANTDGNWYNESVSHTELEQNPWWEVDLQNMSQITRVTLFNRTDCCGERLNNAVVVIFDANRREVARRSIGNAQNVMPVSFGVRGRYVRVVLPRRDYLSLAEVRVIGSAPPMVTPNMVNLALNKPARQSSTHRGGSASRAADANTDGNWYNESVSHTELEQNPWWEVDLQNMSQITRVTLFNRTDCCGERLNNAVVVIFDANRREVARRSIGNAQNVMPVSFGVRGRYVRVVLPRRDYLSLAEVRVIGSAPPMVTPNMVNLALNKPARQSSTHRGGSASRAADANTDGNWYNESVSHTELEQNPWWEVDLQNMSQITRVTLFNRTDCCGERLNNAVVVIFDANRREVARRSIGNAQNVMPVSFGVRGRYVRVVLPRRDYLSLAEVRVIGLR